MQLESSGSGACGFTAMADPIEEGKRDALEYGVDDQVEHLQATEILAEPPAVDIGDGPEALGSAGEPAISLVSLNERTARTVDVCNVPLNKSAKITCGRGEENTIVLRDPRVSVRHFCIQVRCTTETPALETTDAGEVEPAMQTDIVAEEVADGGAPGQFPVAGSLKGAIRLELRLVDESSNGTWLNDKLLGKDRPHAVSCGDRIFVLPSSTVGQQSAIGYVLVLSKAAMEICAEAPAIEPPEPVASAGELRDTMRCRLCGEAPVHRCVTLVPCSHTFDLGCILAWRYSSARCPVCNGEIRQIVRNRGVDRIVDTLQRNEPDTARSRSTLKLLEAIESDPRNDMLLRRLLIGAPITLPTSCGLASLEVKPSHAEQVDGAQELGTALPAGAALPSHLAHLAPFVPEPNGDESPRHPLAVGRSRPQRGAAACVLA